MSAASLEFVSDPSHFRSSPARNSCALATAAEFALNLKKKRLPLAAGEQMVTYKQFKCVSSAFLPYKSVGSDVEGPERSECLTLAATENAEVGAAARVRPGRESSSLLQALVSRIIQPWDLVVDLFPETFSTVVACFTKPH